MVVSFFQRQRATTTLPHSLLVLILLLVATTIRGKEIIATYEWQKLGPTDTVPAGLEIRMDLGGEGGTWVRLPPPLEEAAANEPNDQQQQQQEVVPVYHKDRCGPSCKERQKERAEKRRAAGFRLRGPSHKDMMMDSSPNDNDNHIGITSIMLRGGIFIVCLTIGVGVMVQLRTRNNNGLHEH